MKDVVFFSNKCANCKEFLNTFLEMPFKDSFCYISVDKRKDDDLIKILEIEFVPTIFVRGNMMVGSQAFLWLEKQLLPAQEHRREPQEPIRPPVLQRPRQPPAPVVEEFTVQPLGGDFSGYASIADEPMDGGASLARLPAPEHVRKGEKIDEKSMAEMLTQLNEERKHGIPLSISEQKAQHAAMQDRYA
jgi:hypothetical protein